MLIAIMPDEIHKLENFMLYSQNPNTLLCCGITNDTESSAVFYEVTEIPTGQEQRCLPQSYGKNLNLERIEHGIADYTELHRKYDEQQQTINEYETALTEIETALGV